MAAVRRGLFGCLAVAGLLTGSPRALGLEGNLQWPQATIEQKLLSEDFEIAWARGSRYEGDRTQRVGLKFGDGSEMTVKWAPAPRLGGEFNNRPRYEVAAYEIQKLLFDEADFVVPPTVFRVFPTGFHDGAVATPRFTRSDSSLVVLQYWLQNVTPEDVFDLERFETDEDYRRRLAILNIFTHLVRHNDTNKGNFLISEHAGDPRLWAVDNGLAFSRREQTNKGFEWRDLRVDRLPRGVVERLRQVDLATLTEKLGVLAEFRIQDRQLVRVSPGGNLGKRNGVRHKKNVVQFGLTAGEISDIHGRLTRLLRRVDAHEIETF